MIYGFLGHNWAFQDKTDTQAQDYELTLKISINFTSGYSVVLL